MNMAKNRKIATDFFDQRWVLDWMFEGKSNLVLFYIYLFTSCRNNVGVWETNFREWNFRFRFDPVLDETNIFALYGSRIKPLPGHPDKIILTDFISFQTSGWGAAQQNRVDEDLAALGLTREDITKLVRGGDQLELAFVETMNKPKVVDQNELRFVIPPPRPDVLAYFEQQKQTEADAAKFFDYWESIGWKRGARRMIDWQASARTWIANTGKFGGPSSRASSPIPSAAALKPAQQQQQQKGGRAW